MTQKPGSIHRNLSHSCHTKRNQAGTGLEASSLIVSFHDATKCYGNCGKRKLTCNIHVNLAGNSCLLGQQ